MPIKSNSKNDILDLTRQDIMGTDISALPQTSTPPTRTIDTNKKRINITSIFAGEQSIVDKLFMIADRRLKNIDVTATKAG